MKVAISHDWLVSFGGAERVLEALLEIFPEADIFTSVLDRSKLPPVFDRVRIKTSFIQTLPFAGTKYRSYIGLMPAAFRSFDLKGYDLIISSSHACAKAVRKPKGVPHICYCHTPMRYIWDMYDEYMSSEAPGMLVKLLAPAGRFYLRGVDVSSSKDVDRFIANSSFVADRIKRYYGRDSEIIHPPVDTKKFKLSEHAGGYYLVVSRLVPQKRTDVIVKAFNEMGKPLKIVGTGRDEERLKRMAGPNIEFLGFRPDDEVAGLMSGCKALVFASLEDFGIVPVEAMSCGRPVIAYGAGGVLDAVVSGDNGTFFYEQTPFSIAAAVLKSEKTAFDPVRIRRSAEKFDKSVFKEKIRSYILEHMQGNGKAAIG